MISRCMRIRDQKKVAPAHEGRAPGAAWFTGSRHAGDPVRSKGTGPTRGSSGDNRPWPRRLPTRSDVRTPAPLATTERWEPCGPTADTAIQAYGRGCDASIARQSVTSVPARQTRADAADHDTRHKQREDARERVSPKRIRSHIPAQRYLLSPGSCISRMLHPRKFPKTAHVARLPDRVFDP